MLTAKEVDSRGALEDLGPAGYRSRGGGGEKAEESLVLRRWEEKPTGKSNVARHLYEKAFRMRRLAMTLAADAFRSIDEGLGYRRAQAGTAPTIVSSGTPVRCERRS